MKIKAERMAELVKFGIDECLNAFYYYDHNYGQITVNKMTREIIIEIVSDEYLEVSETLLKLFYDIIKADMIEE